MGCCARALPIAAVVSGLLIWVPQQEPGAGSVAVVSLSLCVPTWPCVHSRGGGDRACRSWGQNNCELLMEAWDAAGRSSQSRSQLSRNIGLHFFSPPGGRHASFYGNLCFLFVRPTDSLLGEPWRKKIVFFLCQVKWLLSCSPELLSEGFWSGFVTGVTSQHQFKATRKDSQM